MGDWTLTFVEEKGMVFVQSKDKQSAKFTLSVPAAKKNWRVPWSIPSSL